MFHYMIVEFLFFYSLLHWTEPAILHSYLLLVVVVIVVTPPSYVVVPRWDYYPGMWTPGLFDSTTTVDVYSVVTYFTFSCCHHSLLRYLDY